MDEMKDVFKNITLGSSPYEPNTFEHQYMQLRDQAAFDDFHGLSFEQMHRFVYAPFDTPRLATILSGLDSRPQAPILFLFNLLVDAIGDDGLEITPSGCLPLHFCRETARTYYGDEEYRRRSAFGKLKAEREFRALHTTRLVAGLAGVIREEEGRFILSKECRALLADEQGQTGIYSRMFHAFVREFDWACQDDLEEIRFIRQSFLFSLYLLSRYGGEWLTNAFYEDSFIRAFPHLLSLVSPLGGYCWPERVVRLSYSTRCLERFARFFGLVEIERNKNDRYSEKFRVRKLPLLDQAVQFHL
jgi:hypothetical protein